MKSFKEALKSENVLIAVFVFLIVSVTAMYLLKKNDAQILIQKPEPSNTTAARVTQAGVSVEKSKEEIKVYVVGAVKKPGVITLHKGQIIEEAVALAGGFQEDADVENVNLAFKLTENVMLRIRSKSDKTQEAPVSQNTPLQKVQEGYQVIRDSLDTVVPSPAESSNATQGGGMLQMNTATKEQWMTLPGIGESLAQRILQYREKNGGFKSKEEIKNVSGIGDAKYEAIKDSLAAP